MTGPNAARASKRVVLVDDDDAQLDIVTQFLSRAGHEVVTFSQFPAAKDYLTNERTDVVITDIRLGAFNGLQLVIQAKVGNRRTLAIVLTWFDDPVVQAEAAKAGAEYMVKPVNIEELLARIERS